MHWAPTEDAYQDDIVDENFVDFVHVEILLEIEDREDVEGQGEELSSYGYGLDFCELGLEWELNLCVDV